MRSVTHNSHLIAYINLSLSFQGGLIDPVYHGPLCKSVQLITEGIN